MTVANSDHPAHQRPDEGPDGWRFPLWYKVALVLGVLIFVLFSAVILLAAVRFGSFEIRSGSMEPILVAGEHVVVDRWRYRKTTPQRGHIVVAESPEVDALVIYRVVATEGETISIVDKQVHIDGHLLEDPWGVHRHPEILGEAMPLGRRDNFPAYTLGEHEVFLLGDNRDYSYDSRFFGPVSERSLRGRVLFVYWPTDSSRFGEGL